MSSFDEIEFRSIGGDRQACLKGALPVWQLIIVAHSYELDTERTAQHFGWLVRRIRAALNYYEAFPLEINQALADNHAMTKTILNHLLPQIETLSVPISLHALGNEGTEAQNL